MTVFTNASLVLWVSQMRTKELFLSYKISYSLTVGYYLNSKEDCILPHQCECKDEDGLLRRPNEQWRPDTCSVCNCRNGEVKCKKECKVTSCPEVSVDCLE